MTVATQALAIVVEHMLVLDCGWSISHLLQVQQTLRQTIEAKLSSPRPSDGTQQHVDDLVRASLSSHNNNPGDEHFSSTAVELAMKHLKQTPEEFMLPSITRQMFPQRVRKLINSLINYLLIYPSTVDAIRALLHKPTTNNHITNNV